MSVEALGSAVARAATAARSRRSGVLRRLMRDKVAAPATVRAHA